MIPSAARIGASVRPSPVGLSVTVVPVSSLCSQCEGYRALAQHHERGVRGVDDLVGKIVFPVEQQIFLRLDVKIEPGSSRSSMRFRRTACGVRGKCRINEKNQGTSTALIEIDLNIKDCSGIEMSVSKCAPSRLKRIFSDRSFQRFRISAVTTRSLGWRSDCALRICLLLELIKRRG